MLRFYYPYPETLLLVGFDLAVKVFQGAGKPSVDQILPHMFVCSLHRWPHGDPWNWNNTN